MFTLVLQGCNKYLQIKVFYYALLKLGFQGIEVYFCTSSLFNSYNQRSRNDS